MVRKQHKHKRKASSTGVSITKKHRTHRVKRHRMHGLGSAADFGDIATRAGGVIAGAVIGREANNLLQHFMPSATPIMSAALQIGGGILLMTQSKSPLIDDIAMGIVANGGMSYIVSTGIIGAPYRTASYTFDKVGANGLLPAVSGQRRLNGVNVNTGAQLPTVSGVRSRKYSH